MVSEKGVLFLADLDRGSAVLKTKLVLLSFFLHCLPPFNFAKNNVDRNDAAIDLLHTTRSLSVRTCGTRTLSPGFTDTSIVFPSLSRAPGPTASTLASLSSLTALSGRKMPPAVLVSIFTRCTRTRSRRGATARMDLRAVDCRW